VKRPTAESEARLDELRTTATANATASQPPAISYYDLPLLKAPVWTWEVPTYFFVGGAAGAAAILGVAAQLARVDPELVKDARRIAAAGAALSAPLLIADLGRPERFLYMLRIFKPQSPMSVGAWTVAVFGGASTAAVLPLKTVADVSAIVSALSGLVMATYTGVLIGATTIPVWKEHVTVLPVHFGASALGSAVSLLQLRGHHSRALHGLALGAAIFETITGAVLETDDARVSAPLRQGPTGRLTRLGGLLSGPIPLVMRLFGGKSKRARQAAALSTLAGSLITRFAWIEAGKVSAKDVGLAL
jgi:formate-dependent nitrite reductase membrane component NrfD